MDQGNDERDENLTMGAGMEAGSDWRAFFRRHWGAVMVFVVAAALAVAWAVYVFWWFAGNAQSTGLVPSALGFWTMGSLVNFVIYSVLWELLLVGLPVAVAAVVAWMWWRRLPNEERVRYRWGNRSRSAGGGSGVGFLFFVAFAIKVYIDGNWNIPISAYSLNYVVGSMITILVWIAVIFGIPIAIGVTWWVRHELKKP
jgi:hypothetical protein